MELRFHAILYSNMGNGNSDAGHFKCSRGLHLARRLPIPALNLNAKAKPETFMQLNLEP